MGRQGQEWTQAKFERYRKEGRGEGSGKDYKPWHRVREVPSKGRSSRPPGWKTNREHHLLSDNETRLFYLFEWSDAVKDIREQYPLLDLDLAMSIADDMGIKYPIQNDTPWILTTDFMLTVNQNGKSVQIARTVKETKDLEKQSVAEKFELERRYYIAKGIDWGIVTEKHIPRLLAENVGWVHPDYWLEATAEMDVAELRSLASTLKFRLQESDATINKVTAALDGEMNIENGTSLRLFKHLVARKEILMDVLGTKISSCPSTKAIKKIIF
jgi:hypothetical protein